MKRYTMLRFTVLNYLTKAKLDKWVASIYKASVQEREKKHSKETTYIMRGNIGK
jgi:hypothetical protein